MCEKIQYRTFKRIKKDLIGIKQYIKYNLQEPKIANKLISNIRKSIKNLKDNPEIYTIIDDDMIRKFIVGNYIIFYRIKNDSIEIVRIMYERKKCINLL